jgi:hypothetical protein
MFPVDFEFLLFFNSVINKREKSNLSRKEKVESQGKLHATSSLNENELKVEVSHNCRRLIVRSAPEYGCV